MKQMCSGGFNDNRAQCGEHTVFGMMNILTLAIQPAINSPQHFLARGANRPGFRSTVIITNHTANTGFASLTTRQATTDAISNGDNNSFCC